MLMLSFQSDEIIWGWGDVIPEEFVDLHDMSLQSFQNISMK